MGIIDEFVESCPIKGWQFVPSMWNEEELVFSNVSEIVKSCNVKEFKIGKDRLLVFADDDAHEDNCKGDITVHWVILESEPSNNDDYSNCYSLIAYGCGPSALLREPRHSYFKEYQFYIPINTIIQAFEILKKWFDFEG